MSRTHNIPRITGDRNIDPINDQEDQLGLDSEHRICEIIKTLKVKKSGNIACAMRLLAIEIAENLNHEAYQKYTAKSINDRIKNLSILSRQIQMMAEVSIRDPLNLDGPAFKYVLSELCKMFRSSILDSGYNEDQANCILRIFRDTLSNKEESLRQEVKKIGKGSSSNNVIAL